MTRRSIEVENQGDDAFCVDGGDYSVTCHFISSDTDFGYQEVGSSAAARSRHAFTDSDEEEDDEIEDGFGEPAFSAASGSGLHSRRSTPSEDSVGQENGAFLLIFSNPETQEFFNGVVCKFYENPQDPEVRGIPESISQGIVSIAGASPYVLLEATREEIALLIVELFKAISASFRKERKPLPFVWDQAFSEKIQTELYDNIVPSEYVGVAHMKKTYRLTTFSSSEQIPESERIGAGKRNAKDAKMDELATLFGNFGIYSKNESSAALQPEVKRQAKR